MDPAAIIVDVPHRLLAFRGMLVELTAGEAELAALFVASGGEAPDVHAIMASAYDGRTVEWSAVYNSVRRLRAKLAMVGLDLVSSGYGQGWKMTAASG